VDNRFGEIEIFLAVARAGSFAGAAKALRVTPSAVSRAIGRLEARLGVHLIQRTTRALTLTPEGEGYRGRMSGLITEIEAIERGLVSAQQGPRGPLRINASVPFGTHCLLPILPRFLEAYPGITVDLSLSDAVIDLVEQRADIAIRIGPLRDTRLRAKKLGRTDLLIVASPDYLRRHGEPTEPQQLDQHVCLQFSFRRSIDSWAFRIGDRLIQRPVDGPFMGNSGEVVRLMAVAGGGIARMGRFHVAADLAAGRLVEVLQPFRSGDTEDIHALFGGQERLASRVRAFLDFLDAELRLPG
jgi:DNA-binding transcriptional LysR family regulator